MGIDALTGTAVGSADFAANAFRNAHLTPSPPALDPTPPAPIPVPGTQPLPPGVEPYQLQLFPTEAYNRVGHYGRTPTPEQRASVPPGMEFDHDPTLVQHYYEGPGDGSLPGYNLTQQERVEFGASLEHGGPATPAQQRAQGAAMARYSRKMKEMWGL
jgi:hypothetical protein